MVARFSPGIEEHERRNRQTLRRGPWVGGGVPHLRDALGGGFFCNKPLIGPGIASARPILNRECRRRSRTARVVCDLAAKGFRKRPFETLGADISHVHPRRYPGESHTPTTAPSTVDGVTRNFQYLSLGWDTRGQRIRRMWRHPTEASKKNVALLAPADKSWPL